MDTDCRGQITTRLTQYQNGSCRRTTIVVEHGVPLGLVAKCRHPLFINAEGNLCTSGYYARRACRRLYLRLDGSEIRFTDSIGQAALLTTPNQWLPRLIEMIQINCENCARLEIGNKHQALKIKLPPRTAFQTASLKAKVKADKTGRPVPVIFRRRKVAPDHFHLASRRE